MKYLFIALVIFPMPAVMAKEFESYQNWKSRPAEKFSDAEASFKKVMDGLLANYIDKNLTQEDLYRAATAGMLMSLNANDQVWNKLLTPFELREIENDLSGKVSGIGVGIKFDESSGHGQILNVIPNSPGARSGLRREDQILSVDGKKFKGRQFRDLVYALRGETGKAVALKVLRDDKILNISMKRDVIRWTPVEQHGIDASTAVLTIGYFTQDTPRMVEEKLKEISRQKITKVIIDVRDNAGGGFDQALEVSELFLPKEAIIAKTKDRNGKIEEFKSGKNTSPVNLQYIILANRGTSSGAELFAAALRENKNAKIVGEATGGKWNAQILEHLPNKFAMKYTVKEFQSPQGHSYPDVGLRPDVDVGLPKDRDVQSLRLQPDARKRLDADPQLRAAYELIKSA